MAHVMSEWPPTHNGQAKHAPLAAKERVVKGSTRVKLARIFAGRGYKTGAEIGVADGRNALTLCENNPGLQLFCIDPWRKYPENPRGGPQEEHNANWTLAQERLKPFQVTFLRGFSMEMVQQIEPNSLDFVYIDGHHGFDYVMQDLIEWSRRVRQGGMVAGHDYYHFKWAGVVEAVNAYTEAHQIRDWWLTDEREPSFYWIKP